MKTLKMVGPIKSLLLLVVIVVIILFSIKLNLMIRETKNVWF